MGYYPELGSASLTRFIAGCFGCLIFTQFGEGPGR